MVTNSIILFKNYVNILELLATDFLSQNNSAGPPTSTPKHLILYCKVSIISVAVISTINYDPEIEGSTVFLMLTIPNYGFIIDINDNSRM